jgi:TolB-like protein
VGAGNVPGGVFSSEAPSQLRRLGGFLVVIALIALVAGFRRDVTVSPSRPKLMLAVLPFENLSGDPKNDYLSAGLTEELISHLGHLGPNQLNVIGRTSVMRYKQTSKRIDQIGRVRS